MSDSVQDILKKRELQRLHELENTISRKDSLNREEKYKDAGILVQIILTIALIMFVLLYLISNPPFEFRSIDCISPWSIIFKNLL